ncbi:integrin alpha [Marinicella sediminis]|uniref:Integrin alpha n=1 Tax=Marinicella sediminis TaxID=1792834 RepID=A0ABV7J7J3_9GAMM|nr:integrin alpha [Marinicella sediminis]
MNPANLDGSNGIVIQGENPGDLFGSVSGAGDFNGDGIGDLLVGAGVARKTYVIYGTENSLPHPLLVSEMDATQGFIIDGTAYSRRVGTSVRFAGDLNGDGISDVVIGAPEFNTQRGFAFVVFGSNSFTLGSIDLTTLNGENGFYIPGGFAGGNIGASLNNAGDFNGDGIDDLIIGGPNSTLPSGANRTGAAFVIFGKTDGFPGGISLHDMSSDTGFIMSGTEDGDWLGGSVSFAGDFNKDGIDDIIIGASGANDNFGFAYIIFGSQSEFPPIFYVNSLDQNTGE